MVPPDVPPQPEAAQRSAPAASAKEIRKPFIFEAYIDVIYRAPYFIALPAAATLFRSPIRGMVGGAAPVVKRHVVENTGLRDRDLRN